MNQVLIPGDKITFSIGEILAGKRHKNSELKEIDLKELLIITSFMVGPDIRRYGGMDLDSFGQDMGFWTCNTDPVKGSWQVTFPLTDQ